VGGAVVRASDDDRERTMLALRRHYADGRLDADELEERIDAAARARSRGELRALTIDLPRDVRARGARAVARVDAALLRAHGAAYVGVNGALVALWGLTGAGAFWPAWVIVPWGAGLLMHAWFSRALRRVLRLRRARSR
jgi:Domain of unknown function (DUF1707)/2TM domain